MSSSQVLSGSGNLNYTNTTGKNVRVIINFISGTVNLSWGNPSSLATHGYESINGSFGKNISSSSTNICIIEDFQNYVSVNNGNTRYPTITINSVPSESNKFSQPASSTAQGAPIEYILSPNHVFRVEGTVTAYNILTITED